MDTNTFLINKNVLYPKESYLLVGIFYKIHNELGSYQNKKQYSDRFEEYLKNENIQYVREYCLPLSFDGEKKIRNRADFLGYIINFKKKYLTLKRIVNIKMK